MARSMTPKNVMMDKAEVAESSKTAVFRRASGPGATLGGRHVFFVGLRASGKTSLGALAAQRLGRTFVDTDQLVVQRAGRTIEEIVQDKGWDEFRRLETNALRAVCASADPLVAATGGGIVLAAENRELLKGGGPVFYLQATTLLVVDRLTRDMDPASRPPLTELPLTEEMSALREERDPLYMEVANFILHAEEPLDSLAANVADKLLLVGR